MTFPGHTLDPTVAMEAAAVGYLLGSIPFGVILTRLAGYGDIRGIGSGNIGATNVLRTGNRWIALLTLLSDGAKGAVAVLIARRWGADAVMMAAIAAFLGHLYPVWVSFRGGKGVATYLGLQFAVFWPIGIACCAVWLAGAGLSRISSVGALAGSLAAPIGFLLLHNWPLCGLSTLLTLLIWWRHRENIQRIMAGTEPRIGRGGQAAAASTASPDA